MNQNKRPFNLLFYFFIPLLIKADIPKDFLYVEHYIPQVVIDLKYYTNDNFIGSKINGYKSNKCIITKDAANALRHVQNDLKHFGYGIKIFDAYRPQKAVDHFVRWAKNNNRKMKSIHYPGINKKLLFKEGYIASKSGHSRGSTVDLTIIDLNNGQELDMGTIYDYFGHESSVNYTDLNYNQKTNRALLQSVMKKYGFKTLKEEWWHFTLHNEPFSDKYFDFNVE